MKDLTQFLERDTEYSPATKVAYSFTRPIRNDGTTAEYFDLMLDIYFNMNISSRDVASRNRRHMYPFSGRGMQITMQNLRMMGLVYFVDGEYFLDAKGSGYIVAALRNYSEKSGRKFADIIRELRTKFTR
jgi:hypothetical protein